MKFIDILKSIDGFFSKKSRTEIFENTASKYGDFPKLPSWFLVFSKLKGFLVLFVAGILVLAIKSPTSDYMAITGLAALPATLLFIFVRSFVLLYQKYVFYKNSSVAVKSNYLNAIKKDTLDFFTVLFIGIMVALILYFITRFVETIPQYKI
jgi:hypothetical protein